MGASTRLWASLACAVALLGTGSYGRFTTRDDIRTKLAPELSEHADIYYPDSDVFEDATVRWSYYHPPNFTVVVEVAVEEDVAKTIRYANAEGLPFLAVNGGHGAISSLANLDHGIEIWLHKLNSIEIAEDGKTATFGGGTQSVTLIGALFQQGKQTVHGVCECVSYLGPALGGGHGALQGKYGMAADQFVSLNIATADGEIITVSEESDDQDLWWAVRGAGHNFGIVTSVTSKVYDVPDGGLLRIPGLDPENPVYTANFMREGVEEIEPELIQPFRDLAATPAAVKTHGLYTDIPTWINTDVNSRGCAREENKVRFPIGFKRYDIPAQREFFDAFAEGTAGDSQFNTSMVLIEQYSAQGVEAIHEDSTAFPNREDFFLFAPVVAYKSDTEEVENEAVEFGNQLRDIVLKGTGSDNLHSYVNYAAGNEGPRAWYGWEPWRLEKLQQVKRKYDPEGKFSYYAPIPL